MDCKNFCRRYYYVARYLVDMSHSSPEVAPREHLQRKVISKTRVPELRDLRATCLVEVGFGASRARAGQLLAGFFVEGLLDEAPLASVSN